MQRSGKCQAWLRVARHDGGAVRRGVLDVAAGFGDGLANVGEQLVHFRDSRGRRHDHHVVQPLRIELLQHGWRGLLAGTGGPRRRRNTNTAPHVEFCGTALKETGGLLTQPNFASLHKGSHEAIQPINPAQDGSDLIGLGHGRQ